MIVTTSTPPIMIEIMVLFNAYSPIVRVILCHFLEQLIVPLSTIIT